MKGYLGFIRQHRLATFVVAGSLFANWLIGLVTVQESLNPVIYIALFVIEVILWLSVFWGYSLFSSDSRKPLLMLKMFGRILLVFPAVLGIFYLVSFLLFEQGPLAAYGGAYLASLFKGFGLVFATAYMDGLKGQLLATGKSKLIYSLKEFLTILFIGTAFWALEALFAAWFMPESSQAFSIFDALGAFFMAVHAIYSFSSLREEDKAAPTSTAVQAG